ncbi:T9SS type A sorting domain-containing protein [Aureispira anguillae]|uniref:T9SS type A sorting domain-containing protein n=1 Tax=Aureispira anguillae TaxID=2864201 RepID=A0A915YHS8_9BACT|nr:T9SS type A sorting domain-containing protein [Aureispira anguillae]BDS13173.1 T9SS type A sorting domain-containing protein [Aureispira anguillae]
MQRFYTFFEKIPLMFLLSWTIVSMQAQTITVIAPNGGETLYSCQQYPITWSVSGGSTSGYYTIDYSLDGGTIWASATSYYLTNNNTFMWTVPNLQSSTVLIRVRDSYNSLVEDISDNLFSINYPIDVVSPNGGEVWTSLNTYTINWTAVGASNRYNIHYSKNNGNTWSTIVTNYYSSSGTYNWNIPNGVFSDQCLVRVTDYNNNCMVDVSDTTFTISPAKPILTIPNGGETWYEGTAYNVRWNTTYLYTNAKLEYSSDSGGTWSTITTSTLNDGIHSWNIPSGAASTNALVRIAVYNDSTLSDTSNAVFEIQSPSITIINPSLGANLEACNSFTISGTKAPSNTHLNYYYSADHGQSWVSIFSNVNSGTSTSFSRSWTVPDSIIGDSLLLRVEDNNTPSISDTSAYYNVIPNNDLQITFPTSTDTLQRGNSYYVRWQRLGVYVTRYRLFYSLDGGQTWNNMISSNYYSNYINSTSTYPYYNWDLDYMPHSDSVLIRVEDYYNSCRYVISDTFVILPVKPILTVPNGGELWYEGTSYTISWIDELMSVNPVLEYSTDSGSTWNTITASTLNDGNHPWLIPSGAASTSALVRIYASNDSTLSDTSNAVFEIQSPSITIINPSLGANLEACNSFTISGTKAPSNTHLNYYYSADHGQSWVSIFSNVNSGTSTSFSRSWTVPDSIIGDSLLLRVEDNNTPSISDTSAYYNVIPNNDLQITFPTSTDTLQRGNSYYVRWQRLGVYVTRYRLFYSLDGGQTWNNMISSNYYSNYINSTSTYPYYNWDLDYMPHSDSVLIRVEDYYNSCRYVISDTFVILPVKPILTVPNGGELWYEGTSYTISWIDELMSVNPVLEYSTDSGSTWNTITASTLNDGNHPWLIPSGAASTSALVRIYASNDSTLSDTSNAVFEIQSPSITIINPSLGANLEACNSFTISGTKAPSNTHLNYYYSADHGQSWVSIFSNVNSGTSTSFSRSWTVPDSIIGDSLLLRVEDNNTPSISDTSAYYNVIPNNDLQITFPTSTDTLQRGNSYYVRWQRLGVYVTRYRLFYSLDGGQTWNNMISSNYYSNYINSTSTYPYYNWDLDYMPHSDSVLIRVEDYYNSCRYVISDTFVILPVKPILTVPNGGELWYEGTSYTISWIDELMSVNPVLEYSTDSGSTWNTITASTLNDGNHPWLIPSGAASTSALVRIYASNDSTLSDTSNAVFEIQSPSITIINPSLGANLEACNSFTISGTKAPSNTHLNYYYSADHGQSWVSIFSNVNSGTSTSFSRSWTVPDSIIGDSLLLRVEDNNTPSISDTSAYYNVIPNNDLQITFPTSTDTLQRGNSYYVRWQRLGVYVTRYRLFYSLDGGQTWNNMISSNYYSNYINSTSTYPYYNWDLDYMPHSDSVLIRVEDYYNSCRYVISDTFVILPVKPILTVPNGGELWYEGTSYTISWIDELMSVNPVLEYSTDSGSTWNTITASTLNDGNHPWLIPSGAASTSALVRIYASNDSTLSDTSNAVFEIQSPSITIINPSLGANLEACNSFTISGTKAPSNTHLNYYYSADHGQSWVSIFSNVNSGTSTSFSRSWTVPDSIIGDSLLLRVEDNNTPSISDTSAYYNVIPNNDLRITFPTSTDTLQRGNSYYVRWQRLGVYVTRYRLFYSLDGGQTWNNMISSNYYSNYINSTSTYPYYNWNLDHMPHSDSVLIRVEDYYNSCRYVISDTFVILPSKPLLTAPNGGEVWYPLSNNYIRWQDDFMIGNVKIEYSIDSGGTWSTIATNATNSGTYLWNTIPNINATNCLVRIIDLGDTTFRDTSDAVFEIRPAVTITTPNGSRTGTEEWGGCTVTSITFDHTPGVTSYEIEYSLDAGITWTNIIHNFYTGSSTNSTYNWTIPNIPSDLSMVRVTPNTTGGAAYADVSDTTFKITKPVVLIQPNYGGVMPIGTVYNIMWISDGISNIYDLDYSTDGGLNWTTIANGYVTSTNTYPWLVPNIPSQNCVIRVRDHINPCKEHISARAFIISPTQRPITLLLPNGLDTLSACYSTAIEWSDTGNISAYNLAYSTDGGTTWTPIVNNYTTTTGIYNWDVPNINLNNGFLVSVSDANDSTIYDWSDALFYIEPQALSTLSDTTICYGDSVQLNVSGGSTYLWNNSISLDNDTSSTPMATPSYTTTYKVNATIGSCVLEDSVQVSVEMGLQAPTVSCTTPTNPYTEVAFAWGSVPAATGWEYSIDSGVTWNSALLQDSSLVINNIVNNTCLQIQVRALGGGNCANNIRAFTCCTQGACPTIDTTLYTSICQGQTVTFGGQTIHTTGIYSDTLSALNGCDSIVNLDLTVHSIVTGVDTQVACLSYTWLDGITYTSSNNTATYTIVGGAVTGCDSIVTLNLTINSTSSGVDVQSACLSYTWLDGITYTSSNNTATHTIVGGAVTGCDSIVTLDLTITGTSSGVDVQSACLSYTWLDGVTYTSSNNTATHTIVGGAVTGCDSIVTLDLTITGTSSGVDVQSACLSYTWLDGVTYTSSNNTATHTIVGGAVTGCDSIVTLNLTITGTSSGVDVQSACLSYTWLDGVTYTSSNNTATHTIVGGAITGCDSIVTLNLTINNTVTGTDTQVACGTYTWLDGITYTSSNNTATHTIVGGAITGCDSVVTLNLTINNTVTGTDTQIACGTYTWLDGVTYTSSNNTATHTIVGGAYNGCDSIVTLDLTVKNIATSVDTQVACGTYTWLDGVTYTSSNNTATHTIVGGAYNGCDSIVTLDLTIIGTASGVDVQSACLSYTWLDGITYTSSNNTATHTVIGGAYNGCDSIVTLNLTITGPASGVDVQSACLSYTWLDGVTYTSSNNTATHTVIGGAYNGCDSIVTLNLTITGPVSGVDVQSACFSYTWLDGNTYTSSNNTATHTIVGGAVTGCDSIVTLNLTIHTVDTSLTTTDPSIIANAVGATYQWLDCDSSYSAISGATMATFTALKNGNYAVEISQNGCVDTSACISILSVGIEKINPLFDEVLIYPNPTNGFVTIDLGSLTDVTLSVFGVSGQLIYQKERIHEAIYKMRLDEPAGVYFIELSTQGKRMQYKLIKGY